MTDPILKRLKEMRRDDADEYTPVHGYIPALIDALEVSHGALRQLRSHFNDEATPNSLEFIDSAIKQIEQRLGVKDD